MPHSASMTAMPEAQQVYQATHLLCMKHSTLMNMVEAAPNHTAVCNCIDSCPPNHWHHHVHSKFNSSQSASNTGAVH